MLVNGAPGSVVYQTAGMTWVISSTLNICEQYFIHIAYIEVKQYSDNGSALQSNCIINYKLIAYWYCPKYGFVSVIHIEGMFTD